MADQRKMDYNDFEIQSLFEGLCEQILDAIGIEKGRKWLCDNFQGFESAIDMKIQAYQQGNRITRKLDKPDESIMRLIR